MICPQATLTAGAGPHPPPVWRSTLSSEWGEGSLIWVTDVIMFSELPLLIWTTPVTWTLAGPNGGWIEGSFLLQS